MYGSEVATWVGWKNQAESCKIQQELLTTPNVFKKKISTHSNIILVKVKSLEKGKYEQLTSANTGENMRPEIRMLGTSAHHSFLMNIWQRSAAFFKKTYEKQFRKKIVEKFYFTCRIVLTLLRSIYLYSFKSKKNKCLSTTS